MPRRQLTLEIPALGSIKPSAGNIARQLVTTLRKAITDKQLLPGESLPSTRALAESLKIARGTVSEAYDQLIAEGWLESVPGSGTRVTQSLNKRLIETSNASAPHSKLPDPPDSALRYVKFAEQLSPLACVPFAIAIPQNEVVMDKHWHRLSNRVRASQIASHTGYSNPSGILSLRNAIVDYLRKSRAVNCQPDNIIITEGTQQALYLTAQVLLSAGDTALVEDPAYGGLTSILEERLIHLHRAELDDQGMVVKNAIDACPEAKVAFVTPSHQYPLGMPLSMTRRFELIEWAQKHNGWIVEDDYDSELRYTGQPFPAMQGMDRNRVIYLGTFSKVLAPSLRLGYIVAPDCLIDAFNGARSLLGRNAATTEQHVIAAYMSEGYFETRIRRIRGIYQARRNTLIKAVKQAFPNVTIQPSDQGMHLVLWLPDSIRDIVFVEKARKVGIALRPISPLCSNQRKRNGLILGFGGFTDEQIHQGVEQLKEILQKLHNYK